MNGSENRDNELAQVLDAREGRSALDSGLGRGDRGPELQGLLEAADIAWTSQQSAPPLADDPVAAMLGLVPDPGVELDGTALGVARKRSGLTVSALAQKLSARGWEVSGRDVFAWESGHGSPQVPALINAIAEEAGVDTDRLRRHVGEDPERAKLAAIVASATFKALAERWARVQGTTLALASSALESRMLIAVHRGGAPEAGVLLDSLEAVVSAVEGPDQNEP